MRILWFSLTSCSAAERNGGKTLGGSWLISLERAIRDIPGITLGIAYFSDTKEEPFQYCRVHYFPIYKSKWERLSIRIHPHVTNRYDEIFLSLINAFNPDLVHIHGSESEFANIIGQTEIPVVLSMQSILAPYEKKYFSGINKIEVLRYDSIMNRILLKSNLTFYHITQKFAKNEIKQFKKLKYIIGRTDWDKRISRLMAPESKYFVVNEILRDDFYSTKWEDPHNSVLTLVTTMSDSLYKGLENVYRTAEVLKEYGIKFEWKIIGQSYGSAYESMVRHATKIEPEQNNIILLGRMPSKKLIEELLQSDIFVQVSHIENSPNSLCEAMIIGMPIIASFVGGTSSLIKNNVEGLLYQDGDVYSLAADILTLAKDKKLSLTMGNEARKSALKRHNKQKIVSELMTCYNSIISLDHEESNIY